MSTDNVTPFKSGSLKPPQDLTAAEECLARARGIVDLLQGAAAHEAIEPPSNNESLAQTLGVVRELLDGVASAIWPAQEDES
jgi:hypothetical protein